MTDMNDTKQKVELTIGQKAEPMIKQKDARILRECLCRVYRKAPDLIKQDIHNELKRYAIAVSSYCKCTDRSFVKDENVFACLDCGTRHQKPLEKDINKIVKQITKQK